MANKMFPNDWQAVTPKDTRKLGYIATSLYIGVGGDVEVVDVNGNTQIFKNAQTGSYIVGQFIKVKRSNTTATNILAAKQ